MKQLVHNLATGEGQVWDVPAPQPGPNDIVVRNRASVISAGTERTVIEFSQQTLLGKALSRPDLAREALAKAKRDGVLATLDSIRNRLNEPAALGYSSAGEVIATGSRVTEFRIGNRVACAGGGYAIHAEAVRIPRTMAALLPASGLSFEEAAFAAIGSVALHALRLASVQVGEAVAIIGLGLIGQLAVQLASAAGCRVVGIDPDVSRCDLARGLGCERVASTPELFESMVNELTRGLGADVVLIAAASGSSEALEVAARVARDRACVVSVGATGMELPRKAFYEKEIDFKISRAYGPGRYDPSYEEEGIDYPPGYVRWTEGRNLQAFLDLLLQGKIRVEPLISHRFPISSAEKAYELVSRGAAGQSLAILLEYPGQHELSSSLQTNSAQSRRSKAEYTVSVGLLGAGNYVRSTLLPAMKTVAGTEMVGICAASGLSAAQSATRGGFSFATTDAQDIIANSKVNTIVIATRHHLHAQQVIAALGAGKHIFCEKPLCLNERELQEIILAYEAASEISRPVFMVGFNRRFAPLTIELKQFLAELREPLLMSYRVNAGFLPSSHWANDPAQGGGRIVGEACHFVDLMTFLCGSQAVQVFATATPNASGRSPDNANLHITFANGSTGVITYATNGHKLFPKERLEVFVQGRVAVLDDFCELELVSGANRRKRRSLFRVDKGHNAEWRAMVQSVLNGRPAPIPFSEIVATTRATLRMLDSLRSGRPEPVQLELRNASPPSSTAVQPQTVRNGSWSGDSRGDGLSERCFGR